MCFRKTELAEGVYAGGDNHMKKKSLLGILVILMVIALALTGCGQQRGEQNAGATGSESQNGTIDEGKVTTEPKDSKNVSDPSQDKTPAKNAEGKYVYTIAVDGVQTEIATCVNVWGYITDDTPYDRVDLKRMSADLGWEETPAGYGAGKYTRADGSFVLLGMTNSSSEYDLPTGEGRVYQYATVCFDANGESIKYSGICVSSRSVSDEPYLIGKSNSYVSFEQIVAYALLADYYRDNNDEVFSNAISGVRIP